MTRACFRSVSRMVTTTDELNVNGLSTPAGNGARTVVAGHYAIDLGRVLGSGGMAIVYLGRDLRTRRDVALKTLREEYRRDPESRARFRREARTMAFLKHPNVARVYDLSEEPNAPWAVLEYVRGPSLKQVVAEEGPLAVTRVADILAQIADALGHLHARGLVHLDVKPQNLLLSPEGVVKLIDFGLAQPGGRVQETIGGATFGTAAYLAPEQATGEAVDVATDVYAVGCVVYELLTGRPPFEANGNGEAKGDVIRAHLEDDPLPPTMARPALGLPVWVDDVVLRALAKSPEARYSDVGAFARAFGSAAVPDGALAGATTLPLPIDDGLAGDEAEEADWGERRPRPEWRVVAGGYRLGGRIARRSSSLGRVLWRLTAAFAVGNLLLALVLFAVRGEVPGVTSASGSMAAGATARVVEDRLRLRSEPGLGSEALALLDAGDELTVLGEAIEVDGELWWPVVVEGGEREGYVWAGGVEPDAVGLRGWVEELIDRVGVMAAEVSGVGASGESS